MKQNFLFQNRLQQPDFLSAPTRLSLALLWALTLMLLLFSVPVLTAQCVDSSLINPNAVCPAIYDPVCGCNGVTYGNECEAVNYGGVTSWTPGECQNICVDSSQIDYGALCGLIYDPVCGCNGVTYGNECEAMNYGGVTSWTPGACPNYCVDSSLIDSTVACTTIYDPVCGCNGVDYPNECEAVYHGGVTSWTGGVCGTTCGMNIALTEYTPDCKGADVCIGIFGGVQPYTFTLNGIPIPNATANPAICFYDLPPGAYYLIVKDGAGCAAGIVFQVFPPPSDFYASTVKHVSCAGGHNGSIQLDVFIDNLLLYKWEGPNGFVSDQEDIFNLAPGKYTVTMTTLDGVCYHVATFEVKEPEKIQAHFTITSQPCDPQVDGCLKITGGVAPYKLWVFYTAAPLPFDPVPVLTSAGVHLPGTTPANPPIFNTNVGYADSVICATKIPPGIYYIVILDANGCFHLEIVPVKAAQGIIVTGEVKHAGCDGSSTGGIDLKVQGNYPPYLFSWSNGATTEDLTGIPPGTYEVKVYSLTSQCVGHAVFAVESLGALETGFKYEPHGTFACVEPSGGTPPYKVLWIDLWSGDTLPSPTLNCIYNLPEGTYMVQVLDANGCTGADWFFIEAAVCAGGEAKVDPDTIDSGKSTTFYLSNWWGAALQWQFKTTLIDWTNIPGATGEVYPTPIIHSSVDRQIWVRAVVICPDGSVLVSTEATLWVWGNDNLAPVPGDVEDRNLFNPDFRREELEQKQVSDERVSILPNVSDGSFSLVFNYASSLPTTILVSDVLGRVAHRQEFLTTTEGEKVSLDFSSFQAAAYFMRVEHFGKTTVHRFLVVK